MEERFYGKRIGRLIALLLAGAMLFCLCACSWTA